jgi:hypothetical protein
MIQRDLFEEELKQEEEKKAKVAREKRTLELIADFNDEGYAEGWHFAVSKAFGDQLDIKLTERKEPVLDKNGEQVYEEAKDKKGNVRLKKDGTPRMKKKTRPVLKWTQGRCYCFSEGHVIYDTPKAQLLLWKDALKHINLRCEVIRAIPNRIENKVKFRKGSVTFILSEPNRDRTELKPKGQYHLPQDDFIDFLETGKLKERSENLKA